MTERTTTYIDKIREQAKRQDVLQAAFNTVADPTDWRAPIDAWVEADKYELVAEAVQYFTATEPRLIALQNGWKRMVATGYRNGPAGP